MSRHLRSMVKGYTYVEAYVAAYVAMVQPRLRCALGIPAILSVVAGIMLLILHFSIQPLLTQRIHTAHQALNNYRPLIQPVSILQPPRLPWTAFPPHTKESSLHALFYLQAEKVGISLPDVQYQQRKLPGTPLIEYRIELNTITTYIALKKWIAAMMSAYPTLLLDHIHIERENIQSDQLKCSLIWSWIAHEKSEPNVAVTHTISETRAESKNIKSPVGKPKLTAHKMATP